MKKNRYDKCESGFDFCKAIENDPKVLDYHYCGDHMTGNGPTGRFTVAANKYEYPPYLRRKIIKMLIAVGLGLMVIIITIPYLA